MTGPGKDKLLDLEKRMNKLCIKKEDIEEKFIKASGRGGQKVNKTSSAVFLRHQKTNLTVKCGKSRSQTLNRFYALRTLIEKIEEAVMGITEEKLNKVEKIKKQKQRRRRKTQKKLKRQ
ncbi:MAG: peptide chain release factor-like protein [Desulfobacula sp.]|nr:peptide chain release factor-like protein [Desulfobacula sp.]MBT7260685.1 peptide chain release factor-like protein [Desulfobacula sp.]